MYSRNQKEAKRKAFSPFIFILAKPFLKGFIVNLRLPYGFAVAEDLLEK